MPFALNPDRSLRELLSAASVDPALRLRLKAHAEAVLSDWGIRTPGQTVYFVEPGQVPAQGRDGETFVELPAPAPELADDALDVVAGGWAGARDQAVQAVDRALHATDWRASTAQSFKASDPWAF